MRKTDVAIVGGGLAGSLSAAMLGQAGIDAVVIDPHPVYPDDFRCEKLDGPQVEILKKTGIADAVLRASTPDRESWVARFGRLVEKRPGDQQGIFYAPLVNTVRGEIPGNVPMIEAKVTALKTGADRQTVTLSTGEDISARLIVLANGLNVGLRDSLGITREILSECHSISIGFDVKPVGRRAFDFPALTYYAEKRGRQDRPDHDVPDRRRHARQSVHLPRHEGPVAARAARRAAGNAVRADARPAQADGRVRGRWLHQDPPGRSLRHARLPPARRGAGGRRLLDLVSGRRHRRAQGHDGRRAAVPRLHSAVARHARHEAPKRSPPSTPIPRSGPATTSAATRHMACGRSRPIRRSPGARVAGSSSSANMRRGTLRQWQGPVVSPPLVPSQNEEPAMPATADTWPRVLASSGGRDQVVRRLAARDLSDVA